MPDSHAVKISAGKEKDMDIKMTGGEAALVDRHSFICRAIAFLCFCIYSSVAVSAYEDEVIEIDGVEYIYYHSFDVGRMGVVLGRHAPGCAVIMPDERKRLCIPKFINDNQVVKIEDEACRHLVDVEEIVLPDGITEIGANAFRECWSLKKINIPATVTVIGVSAFEDCENLKSITLPENIGVGGCAGLFKNCKSLEAFKFPKGIHGVDSGRAVDFESIGAEIFAGCSSLKEIAIPSGVKTIGYKAFGGCLSLSRIEMPPNLKTIEVMAFCGCESLETIDLPESVINIGWEAFKDCIGLKNIKLPYRVTTLGSGLFANCKSLKAISIPENVKIIEGVAFKNCSSLQTVEFSPGIEEIQIYGECIFQGCYNLKEIILPRSIADKILNTRIDPWIESKKIRELPGLKITYLD